MRTITANVNVTLDGVMQAPADANEDTRGGFEHGGWATPYFDKVMGEVAAEGMAKGGGFLFGRRTYENFASFWPTQGDDNPFAKSLNAGEKFVASRTLKEPLPWANSTLLEGDALDSVAKLKRQDGKDIVILGSGVLVESLMERDLIDRFVLLIHPLVLGSGRRLFTDGGAFARFKLVDSKPTTTGVVIATYEPVDARAAEGA